MPLKRNGFRSEARPLPGRNNAKDYPGKGEEKREKGEGEKKIRDGNKNMERSGGEGLIVKSTVYGGA